MAYGIRYNIIQKLRDDSNLYVKIYEKAYTGTEITQYEATNISLTPNSSDDEPLPYLVSSQLNISFIISNEYDFINFPNLLSFDDRKYFVKLYNGDNLLWVGFLFNDYLEVPFTTGNQEVSVIAIDGLSFLKYKNYALVEAESQNDPVKLLDVIAKGLNIINYPDPIMLNSWCSYFAAGMANRTASLNNEPFNQTYQYARDYTEVDYYTILENILLSFGCRMFQSNGEWHIMAINEMADTFRYYTKYNIYPTVSLVASGTNNELIEIKPYSEGNIHFINNSQTKIVRKGYPRLIANAPVTQAINYCHNGNFKQLNTLGTLPIGWRLTNTGGHGHANLVQVPNDQFNTVDLFAGNGPYGYSSLEMGVTPPITTYLPYMIAPSMNLSFEYQSEDSSAKIQISIRLTSGVYYYYNSADIWQTTPVNLTISPAGFNVWSNYTKSISLGLLPNPFGIDLEGYVSIKIFVDGAGFNFINVRNVKINQDSAAVTAVKITRDVVTEPSTTKEINVPYGSFNPNASNNNLGLLVDSNREILKDWYRYGKTGTYYQLVHLMARQFSNLLSKNFATLEGDLGKFINSGNLLYLDNVFIIQDAAANALSYNAIKFMSNRMTIVPQVDEITSFQVIEITNTDNTSTEVIEYIGDITLIRPSRYF